MRLFGRPLSRYLGAVVSAPQYVREAFTCVRTFKDPSAVLRAYITRVAPPSGAVEFRSGFRLLLSSDPLDIVSVFVVFVRRDYGTVMPGARVLDLGANIGVFSVFAAQSGAAIVHAYEPSAESFRLLRRNIDSNGLGDRVTAFQIAAGSAPERTVRFPRKSSVFNAIATAPVVDTEYDEVPLESLETIIGKLGRVDLMKLDCEGEEERILLSADDGTLDCLSDVRLEFHHGRGGALVRGMLERRFSLAKLWQVDRSGGIAWFRRDSKVPTETG